MDRVNVFAIHRCINEGYGLIRMDFHGKNTDFPHEIVACLVSGMSTVRVNVWVRVRVSN